MPIKTKKLQKKINYPYLPEGREILYVPANNEFMLAAKKVSDNGACRKQSTGAVLVKNGKILASGTNAKITVDYCPRVKAKIKTGNDYSLCKSVCGQEGHAEEMAVKNAIKSGINTKGADIYLYGHWWCCENCWKTMIGGGIKNVYLVEGASDKFNISATIGKIYISGALNFGTKELKKTYENIAAMCTAFCKNIYVPHISGTDPIDNPEVEPKEVWSIDHREVASSDLIIAYVGAPSLGVGAELEIARITVSNIIIWYFKGDKVSRMALGNPGVKHIIEAKDETDLLLRLKEIVAKY